MRKLSKKFQLLPDTFHVMLMHEGGLRYRFQRKGQPKPQSLQLLIQSNQILKVANFTLSLSYDFATKQATAIACVNNEGTDPIESCVKHIVRCVEDNPNLWAHPTFLPTLFARHYSDEMRESGLILRRDLGDINLRLGVLTVWSFRAAELPEDWPESLDFRWLITNIHARRVEIMQVREGCKWSLKSLKWLGDLEEKICAEGIVDEDLTHNMQRLLEYHLSIIEGTEGRFAELQEETEASTNMVSSS